MSEVKFYKAELRSIDAWGEPEGGWTWNASYRLEDGMYFGEGALTTRKILAALRKWGYLSEASKGRLRVEQQWPIIEIQMKNTFEPILALMFEEG